MALAARVFLAFLLCLGILIHNAESQEPTDDVTPSSDNLTSFSPAPTDDPSIDDTPSPENSSPSPDTTDDDSTSSIKETISTENISNDDSTSATSTYSSSEISTLTSDASTDNSTDSINETTTYTPDEGFTTPTSNDSISPSNETSTEPSPGPSSPDGNTLSTEHIKTSTVQTSTEDPCLKNSCQNGGTCVSSEGKYRCECSDPWIGDYCERKDMCKIYGNNICQEAGATCLSLEGLNTYLCKCKQSGYLFNTTTNKCEKLHNCYVEGCSESEECSEKGTCMCKQGMSLKNGTCEKIECNDSEEWIEDLSTCVCAPYNKDTADGCIPAYCDVPELNDCDYRECRPSLDNFTCGDCLNHTVESYFRCIVPEENECGNKTNLDCGPNGRCYQEEDTISCVCDWGYNFNGISCEARRPPLDICPEWNGTHCHCPEPMYRSLGFICQRTYTDCQKSEVCGEGATCQISSHGHQCRCPPGQRYNEDERRCTRLCSKEGSAKCTMEKSLCEVNTHGNETCKCPQGQVIGLYGCMYAQGSLIGSLKLYGVMSDFATDILDSMKLIFGSAAGAHILNCTSKEDSTHNCQVELLFWDKVTELRGKDLPCLPTAGNDSICVLPPRLRLNSVDLQSAILEHQSPCQTSTCPPDTTCTELENQLGYSCLCKENLTVISSLPSSGPHVIQICEDKRCETHNCPPHSSCYIDSSGPSCQCDPGTILNKTSGLCIELCNPNPCLHNGTCLVTDLGVSCKCKSHYVGSLCEGEELRSARSTLVLVAAVLGAAIFVLLIVSVVVINRYRREAKCSRNLNHGRLPRDKARLTITPHENFGFDQE